MLSMGRKPDFEKLRKTLYCEKADAIPLYPEGGAVFVFKVQIDG